MWFNSGALANTGAGGWVEYTNLPIARAWKTIQTQPFALDYAIFGDNNSEDNDDLVVSTDTSIWSSLQGDRSAEWAYSVFGGGKVWLAQKSGDPSYSIQYTTNLQDYDSQLIVNFSVGNAVEINEILWDGTQLVIIGKEGDEGIVLAGTSATEEPWPNVRWPSADNYQPRGIDYNGSGTYLLVGSKVAGSTFTPTNIIYRQQGDVTDTWEEITVPATLNWSQVKYGNGRWVLWARGSTTVAISTDDGDTWTTATLPVAFSGGGGSSGLAAPKAAFGLDRFHYYAGSRIYTSSDGIAWARSDSAYTFTEVTDWTFSEDYGLATGVKSVGNHTNYLKYEVQG